MAPGRPPPPRGLTGGRGTGRRTVDFSTWAGSFAGVAAAASPSPSGAATTAGSVGASSLAPMVALAARGHQQVGNRLPTYARQSIRVQARKTAEAHDLVREKREGRVVRRYGADWLGGGDLLQLPPAVQYQFQLLTARRLQTRPAAFASRRSVLVRTPLTGSGVAMIVISLPSHLWRQAAPPGPVRLRRHLGVGTRSSAFLPLRVAAADRCRSASGKKSD